MIYDCRRVCVNCFSDMILQDLIEKEGENGDCDWCESNDAKTIHIYELSEMFRNVADCYDEVTGPDAYLRGETISYLLQEDWNIFSDKIGDDCDLVQEMTLAIMVADTEPKERVDFPDYNGFFIRQMPDLEFEWFDKLEKMLNDDKPHQKSKNNDDLDELPDRIEFAIEDRKRSLNAGDIFWRARIHKDRKRKDRLTLSEMSAPSTEDATAGRANSANEPVLYLATDYKTALAEVRSWRGMAVAVAEVRLKQDIRVLDLIELHYPKSPFDSEYLCYDLQVIGLLQSFGSALSHPLLPGEEEKLYLPSQKLCEFVRQHGVEGILYPSAMGAGNNLVVFNPDSGEPIKVIYYRVGTPDFFPKLMHELDDIYVDWPYADIVDE